MPGPLHDHPTKKNLPNKEPAAAATTTAAQHTERTICGLESMPEKSEFEVSGCPNDHCVLNATMLNSGSHATNQHRLRNRRPPGPADVAL